MEPFDLGLDGATRARAQSHRLLDAAVRHESCHPGDVATVVGPKDVPDLVGEHELILGAVADVVLGAGLGTISNELERALIADLGVPVDYLQIRSSTALRGISDVQISVGWRIGENTFVTLSPRLCGSEFQNPGLFDFYPSVEQRLSRAWRFSFSVDPGTPCGAFGGRLQNPLTQIGTDLFWEKRY